MRQIFFKAFIGTVVSHLLAACATRPASLPDVAVIRNHLRNKKSVSVLFIGNSLSFGLPKELEKIGRESGMDIHATLQAYSGWNLAQHLKSEETIQVLRGQRWDIVVLQEQSRIPSQRIKRRTHMIPAVRQLAHEAREVGAMSVLYQTWGYRNGDKQKRNDDFYTMNRRLREGYHAAARVEKLCIVSVGDAWEGEVAKGRGEQLFMSDGLHPSSDGVTLNAQVFYESLFSHAAPKNRKIRLNVAKPTRDGG